MPDVMHEQAATFLHTHKNKPFFMYCNLSHVHGDILPTPDSATGTALRHERQQARMRRSPNYHRQLVRKVSAELIDAKLPETVVFDARSIAPQLRGEAGTPRERVDSQLAAMWYVRDAKWKLNEKAELYDMSNAPFAETLITIDAPESTTAQPRRSRACREVR